MKNRIYISILLLSCIFVSSFTTKFKPVFNFKVIVIDPGHGGKDPGCHGSKFNEKDIALAVSLKLGKYIEAHIKGVKVIYTRSTDVFVELQERAEIANRAKADLFVSIHCNSACVRDKKLKRDVCRELVHGAETYVMGIKNEKGKLDIAKRENSAILLEDNYVKKYDGFDPNSDESYIIMSMFADTYLDQSLSFASKTQNQYSKQAGRADKGVKRASLWVLWRTFMPSVLTEIGYLSNLEEELYLGSEKGQDNIAIGIFKSFREYKDELEGVIQKYDDVNLQVETPKEQVIISEDKKELNRTELNNPIENSSDGTKKENKNSFEQENTNNKTLVTNKNSKELEKEKVENIKTTEKQNLENEKSANDKLMHTENSSKTINTVNKNNIELAAGLVVYKVQLFSSEKKIPLNSEKFKNIENPGEYIDKGVYKYTAGEYTNQKEAKELQITLRKNGFKDAFIISMQNNKRIPLVPNKS